MNYQNLRCARDGSLAVITLDRPKVNALNQAVLEELLTCVRELELDDDVRVVAITGEGKAFVAGADISAMADMSPKAAHAFSQQGCNLGEAIETSAKPYIAAVNGFALGGGCELALACDFIYASAKAKFGQPEVKLGVIPGFGGTQRLARRVGIAKAKELIFTGDMISADEGMRLGLVDAVVAPDELMAKVAETAARIAGNGPIAVAEAKRVIHEGFSMTQQQGVLFEQLAFAGLFDTADQREGMAAFVDQRAPNFQGH